MLLVYETDFPLAWASNGIEFTFYLDTLIERGLMTVDKRLSTGSACLTGKGWDHIEDRTRHPVVSNQGFIVMSFDKSLEPVWLDAIAPAIEANGYHLTAWTRPRILIALMQKSLAKLESLGFWWPTLPASVQASITKRALRKVWNSGRVVRARGRVGENSLRHAAVPSRRMETSCGSPRATLRDDWSRHRSGPEPKP